MLADNRGNSASTKAHGRGFVVDDTDYEHRTFVNLLAAAALLAIAIGVVWTVKSIQDSEKTEACVLSGRTSCMQIFGTPHAMRIISR